MIEIKVQQNAFAAALNAVTKASTKGMSLQPAFELIRLEVSSNRMQLTCFNGEFAARGTLPAQCLDAGSANVNAVTLREIVQTMNGEITLKFSEDEVRLESGSNRAYLRLSTETLPTVNNIKTEDAIALKGAEMKKLAGVALFASIDSSRASLQGIHLTITNDETGQLILQAQAADGFCLGRIRVKSAPSPDSVATATRQPRIISGLPSDFLKTLATVIDADDEVLVQFPEKGNQAIFQIRGEDREFLFVTAILQDEFPVSAVDELVAKTLPAAGAELVIQNGQLERIIRQVNAMGTRNLFIKVRTGLIRVAQVWVNTDMLLKLIKVCSTEMSVKIGRPTDPILFKSGDLLALVMPLHDTSDPFEGEDDMPIELTLDEVLPVTA
jgi:DNA polymerase III sliding clamp (beta) subunit (PCNA family)